MIVSTTNRPGGSLRISLQESTLYGFGVVRLTGSPFPHLKSFTTMARALRIEGWGWRWAWLETH